MSTSAARPPMPEDDSPGTEAPARERDSGRPQRVVGVDVARGLALVGIIVVNLLPAADADGDPLLVWALLVGRAAALFALLAGVSIALVAGGRSLPASRTLAAHRAALALRAVMIVALGLLVGSTEPPVAVILPYYGILFLLAVPLLGLGRSTLLALAVVFAVLGPVAMQLVRAWVPDMTEVDDEYTFLLVAEVPGAFLRDMLLTGFYPALPWLAYICVGMVVGRLDLTSRRVAAYLLAAGAALAMSMWLLSAALLGPGGGLDRLAASTPRLDAAEIDAILVFGAEADTSADFLPATTGWWLAVLAPYTSTPITILHTLGVALAVLGAVLLIVPYLGRAAWPAAAVGSMTLTLYSAHLLILAAGIPDAEHPAVEIAFHCLLLLLVAVLWRASFGKGPLESVVASATGRLRALVRTGR